MRYNWVIPVLALVLVVAAVGYWGYGQYREKQQMQVYLGNQYNESFYNLLDRIEDCTALLGKGLVSTGQRQMVSILTDCWRRADAAQEALNQLPISNATLIKTSKFLAQLGDYCSSLAKANIQQRVISENEKEKLASLRRQAANLSEALHNLESNINRGRINWWETVKKTRRTIDEEDKELLSNNFRDMVEANEPFPTLIYDGPFSDHIEQRKPKGLTGDNINQERAREIATQFCDYQNRVNLVVKDLDDVEGIIPAYQFSVQPEGDNDNHTTIDVSKKGGHVIMYLNPRNVGQRNISRVEAINKGNEFLQSRGFSSMVPTYSWIENNVLTVSYAYKEDDVIIYPDLIKLKVAMDNGQVIGFEGMGYIMSHHKRDLPEPKVSEQEVRNFADNGTQIESVRLAVIPTPSQKELFTWEVRVRRGEETYLQYYDANSGEEVNILKVIDTPEGTFTE